MVVICRRANIYISWILSTATKIDIRRSQHPETGWKVEERRRGKVAIEKRRVSEMDINVLYHLADLFFRTLYMLNLQRLGGEIGSMDLQGRDLNSHGQTF